MSIEYLPGLKVGGKIELKPDKRFRADKDSDPKESLLFLNKELAALAAEHNKDFKDFLSSDGRISMSGPDAKHDQYLVEQQELGFSRETGQDLATWRRTSEEKLPNVAEKALTVALNDTLKDKFIVARASLYDDYNNGFDLEIINKETGDTICGVDYVLGDDNFNGADKKEGKLQKIMDKGGATIKYGAKLENGVLTRAALKNTPAFYLALKKSELTDLVSGLKTGGKNREEVDHKIFSKLLSSLTEQTASQALDWSMKAKINLALDNLQTTAKKSLAA